MAVSKKAKALYNAVFDGIEIFAANKISNYQERRDLRKYFPKKPMPKSYAKEYKKYWSRWAKVSPKWGWYYAARNGIEDVRYIPHTLYYTIIDQKLNARKLGWGFNDKNYYSKIFADIKQPQTIIRSFSSDIFTDSEYNQITIEEAYKEIIKNTEVICKPTQESGSGRGIEFWNCEKDADKIWSYLKDKSNSNYIVQKIIKQHSLYNEIHSSSVNTIRICSILLCDGVHILSSVLRMGVDKSRVDNATAGGISCGIDENGCLKEYAYSFYSGEKTAVHPQGFVFKGVKLPYYDKAVELVKKAHPVIGNFKLVSWDICIDEKGDAVLIEANMRKGAANLQQFANGPLFGDLTERIMDEVYGK
ncbi:MAG: sugar-transfer associated ATP-grasp domain-containing protein [Acutalibacteraceae bacterium]|nr:sugar-transfer associated ATP-grasp domain-containing protein [Acutalibacteraceae bacterium]